MGRFLLALLTSLAGLLLALPVILLALPFRLMSAAIDLFARLTEPPLAARGELIQPDRVLGWRPTANLDTHYLVPRDDVYPIVTDPSGWPGRRPLADSEIVALGDSFAYGYGARRGESFLELDPALRIKAVACPGYDLVQELLVLRELGAQVAGKLVVWFTYPENDLADSVRPHWRGYRKPFLTRSAATGEWEIVSAHLRPARWVHSVERDNLTAFALLCAPGPFADHCYSACEFVLDEAADLCRRAGASLVVLTIPNVNQLEAAGRSALAARLPQPETFDPLYPDRQLRSMCEKRHVPFIAGARHLDASDYKRWERYHWNARGHRKVSRLLRDIHGAWKGGRLEELARVS